MEDQTEILQKMLEMLTLIAEPQIALRDVKLRASLREIVGKSPSKRKAIFQMDGTRSQKEISHAIGIDQGDLSKLVKALRANSLISQGDNPWLTIPLPGNFFELEGGQ